MFGKDDIKKLLSENYPILAILIGITFVSLSIGPFIMEIQTGNLKLQRRLRWGLPYVISFGNIINQPPLGFYIEALFFKGFGASIINGTFLVTILGLGSTVVIYKIGKELYEKATGLFAAVLFCVKSMGACAVKKLFDRCPMFILSLLCLYVGILAIRKGSVKLSLFQGFFSPLLC